MDDKTFRDFFLQPASPRQRQYEALRAVFLDGLSQQEAASRFGYDYDGFRQLVRSFRLSFADAAPPFSTDPAPAAPRDRRAAPATPPGPAGRSARRRRTQTP
jgi:hypothetical protein